MDVVVAVIKFPNIYQVYSLWSIVARAHIASAYTVHRSLFTLGVLFIGHLLVPVGFDLIPVPNVEDSRFIEVTPDDLDANR